MVLSPILSAGADLVGSGIGFSPSGETGEGFVLDLSPVPFPQGKGCLLIVMTPCGSVSVSGRDGSTPYPSGEGGVGFLN